MFKKVLEAWKKLTSGSINRQIFGAAAIVGLLTASIKVVTVAKELIVAWRFGTGDELDAFLIALVVPSLIINVVAGSFNVALIPTYVRVREQQGIKASQRLLSGVMVWSLGLLVITTIAMMAAAPLYLPLIASGFDPQKLNLTLHLLWAIAPIVLLSGILSIWSAVLNAGERFALAAVSPIVTPAITILLLFGFRALGIFALAAGLVCGSIVEMFILGLALYRQNIPLRPKWYKFDANLRQVAGQYAPIMTGAFLMCSTNLVDQSMAAMLMPGSVAALGYANRVIFLPLTLSTTALGTAVIPYFSKMVAREDWLNVRHTLMGYLKLIFALTITLTIFFILGSELIVKLLFQRGSFTASDTQLVAQIINFYALQIPFYVSSIFVVRLINSLGINYLLAWGSGLNLIFNIIGNYVFMIYFGVKGIALSTSFVYLFSFSFLFFFLSKHLKIFVAD
ncbi:polysaccharide biosynthesis C-terminal domain-containing protein [Pleurocapsales cyanobacterium LEGE 06147]|nr:polysaccharide biosynthesis C-terminal domain-containing protein [Pleurocapsales cyanobacterium LEGE 06147]